MTDAHMNDTMTDDLNPSDYKLTAQPVQTVKKTPSKIIFCARSGLPLCKVEALCSQGWPFLSSLQNEMIHPLYGMPLDSLLVRLRNGLSAAEEIAWQCYEHEERELQITVSAVMYSLGAMWLPPQGSVHRIEPSLPAWPVVAGSGKRLLNLASWYHHATSKRMEFPMYRITKTAGNTKWENFSGWLDDAFAIKQEWEKGRASHELNAIAAQKRELASDTVRAEHLYGRVDFRKVWNWIDLQLAQSKDYPAGRRETFKNLFLTGDLRPEEWTTDDVEDLQFAVTECCDIGNEITFFINTRLNGIKAGIVDFFSSFTIISSVGGSVSLDMSPEEAAKTQEFFGDFDSRAASLAELPPPPKKESFATLALFLKAQAQWNILKRRFDLHTGNGKKEGN